MGTCETHFTAWLVTDPALLDQGCMDVVILEDVDVEDDGRWVTDSSKEPVFYAVTTVDARSGIVADAVKEANALMREAGWHTAGDWSAADSAQIVTVWSSDAP
jgi:hypothetical protein